ATFALRWRQLRRMMGVVKSEAVTLALEADPRRLRPGGDKVEVTVLFADIRGFTDFSERHEAPEVVALLNAYFGAVVPLIEAEAGTIDKCIGHGLMALFNAPAACPGHALRAVRAAVAMVRRVHEFNAPAACPGHALRAVRAAVAMVRRVHELKETWARLDRA